MASALKWSWVAYNYAEEWITGVFSNTQIAKLHLMAMLIAFAGLGKWLLCCIYMTIIVSLYTFMSIYHNIEFNENIMLFVPFPYTMHIFKYFYIRQSLEIYELITSYEALSLEHSQRR